MLVRELIEKLQSLPPEAVVVDKDPRERYGYYFHIIDVRKRETAGYEGGDEAIESDSCVVLIVGNIATQEEMENE